MNKRLILSLTVSALLLSSSLVSSTAQAQVSATDYATPMADESNAGAAPADKAEAGKKGQKKGHKKDHKKDHKKAKAAAKNDHGKKHKKAAAEAPKTN